MTIENEADTEQPNPIQILKDQITPIIPEYTMAEAGRKILLADFVKMLENEAGSRTGKDIENVHDMRVATRKMRSTFRLLGEYYKTKPIQAYIEPLKVIATTLGTVRDLDVMIDNLTKYQTTLEEDQPDTLQGVIDRLDKQRSKARKKLVTLLDGSSYQSFLKEFSKFVSHPGKAAKSIEENAATPYQVRHLLPSLIQDHLTTVKAYDNVLGEPTPTTLHALRIEFKRLRYVISFFTDVLGTSAKEFIDDVKLIQDYLGHLNDLEVAQESLKKLARHPKLTDDQVEILKRYIEKLEAEIPQMIESFGDVWAKFNTRTVQKKLFDALLILR